jgi:predicted DNA-binding transcriptional regulator AlpA
MYYVNKVKETTSISMSTIWNYYKKRLKLYPEVNNVMNVITINNIDH